MIMIIILMFVAKNQIIMKMMLWMMIMTGLVLINANHLMKDETTEKILLEMVSIR